MKIAAIIVRVLLGLLFLFASVAYFFNLTPPQEATGDAKLFQEGMKATHYLFNTVKVFELICALCFLSGFFVPLATVVIFPISLNILFYHGMVDTTGLPVAIFVMAANLFLAWYYRSYYTQLFKAR